VCARTGGAAEGGGGRRGRSAGEAVCGAMEQLRLVMRMHLFVSNRRATHAHAHSCIPIIAYQALVRYIQPMPMPTHAMPIHLFVPNRLPARPLLPAGPMAMACFPGTRNIAYRSYIRWPASQARAGSAHAYPMCIRG
jgi:hypothetical protein